MPPRRPKGCRTRIGRDSARFPENSRSRRDRRGTVMRTGQAVKIALVLAGTALLTGCSQMGTTFPRRTTVGTLKSSLSQLEFENDKLRREVAQLKTDSRDI